METYDFDLTVEERIKFAKIFNKNIGLWGQYGNVERKVKTFISETSRRT